MTHITAPGQTGLSRMAVRLFLLTCLTILGASAGAAQEAKVSSIELHHCGLYSNKKTKKESDKASASGTHNVVENNTLIKETRDVPSAQGTSFGCQLKIAGSPVGAAVPFTVILQGPNRTMKGGNSYPVGSSTEYVGITMTKPFEPGTWTYRIENEGRTSAEASFTVTPAR